MFLVSEVPLYHSGISRRPLAEGEIATAIILADENPELKYPHPI